MPLEYPTIRGQSDKEKVEELTRYLFKLVRDIEYEFEKVNSQINQIIGGEKTK